MISFWNRLKHNNKGSSLVIAIIAVSFVAILGTVILSSTMANYQMKVMNYQSKKTFYSAETALEEIYSGLANECYSQLESAYIASVTELVSNDKAIDNAKANENMRIRYLTGVKNKLDMANGGIDTSDDTYSKENLIKYFESFITKTIDTSPEKYAYVDSIGKVEVSGAQIIINDVIVVYQSLQDDYYSNVAVDMVIGYPDIVFNFIDNRNHLNTYLDYCLIGMKGVAVGNASNQSDATVTGGIYAGDANPIVSLNGLTVNNSSKLTLDDGLLVSAGNVTVDGTMNIIGSKLWCVNYNVNTASQIDSDSGSTFYVADDLNLSGNNSYVNLAGSYYGFGWSQNAGDTGSHSSAIVINGEKNTIDISTLSKIIIAGRAYINVSDGYMTADSLGLKELQEIYLVPTRYMINTNPCIPTDDKDDAVNTDALLDEKSFFAADLLDASNPVVRKDDGSTARYFYLNFKDNASRVAYVKRVLDSSYSSYEGWSEINAIATRSIEKLGTSSIPGGAAIKTNGNLYSVTGSSISATGVSVSADELRKNCDDKFNRYALLKMFLYDIGSDDVDDDNSKWAFDISDGALVTINELKSTKDSYGNYESGAAEEHVIDSSRSIYDYVIDTGKWDTVFESDEYKDLSYYKDEAEAGCYGVIAPSGSDAIRISSLGVTKGVILANDRNIVVDTNFTGLIITNGNITVENNAVIKADREITENTINAIPLLKQFFFAYQGLEGDGLSGDDLTSEDLLSYNNWRKNYVAETEGEIE